MPIKVTTDEQFVTVVLHQIERMFRPAFGGNRFFNQDLFTYTLELATTDVDRLRREVHAFAAELGHAEWDVQIRVNNALPSPSIGFKVITPTKQAEVIIANRDIRATELA